MRKIELLMLLLPIVFMIHEYEEIMMFRRWLDGNREELKRRFPKIEAFIARSGLFRFSTATFAAGTAHEFILLSAISVYAVWSGEYQWWFAVLMGHSVHLLVHVAQWAVYQKYVPVIITSALTLPYCVYAAVRFTAAAAWSPLQILLWTGVGIILVLLSFPSAFFIMSRFHRWENNKRAESGE